MNNKISQMIKEGYKILEFKRNVDLITNEEYGVIELKALDGYIERLNITDNQADEVEKVVFKYLEEDMQ
ncbi:hypothetical protein [Clostridium sp. KNHs214]|uniref:hypothetical protein n=1 Tax=Clostridium sp. KNHs214 TaxID=1540257 RepID=UPI0005573458|nr:hypothetical protein [Clostridium sp. KNHs214]